MKEKAIEYRKLEPDMETLSEAMNKIYNVHRYFEIDDLIDIIFHQMQSLTKLLKKSPSRKNSLRILTTYKTLSELLFKLKEDI